MDGAILNAAIELLHLPSRVRSMRAAPLPDGILLLLSIATGDEKAMLKACELTGRPRETIREAVTFFIEQILFAPGADSYRVLGVDPSASTAELRRNMALLIRWLHPDHIHAERTIFVGRITLAWNDLKTADRRAAYDHQRRSAPRKKGRRKNRAHSKLHNPLRPLGSPGRASPAQMIRAVGSRDRKRPGLLHRLFLFLQGTRVETWK